MKAPEFIFQANDYPIGPGIRLIEASAGTGKTFSLAHLVLRLITEENHKINEILVVSFTRATASEIKAIIGKRILSALKSLEGWGTTRQTPPEDEVLTEWINSKVKDEDQRSNWTSLLLEALESLDNADITTIHSFCNRTLKREAIESGSHLKTLLDIDDSDIFNVVAHEYWTTHVLDLDPRHIKGLQKNGLSVECLSQNLEKIDNEASLDFRVKIPDLKELMPLSDQFDLFLRNYWLKFCSNWSKEGNLLEDDLRGYAEYLRAQGISDTKPFVPKPRKDRHKLLTKWIESFTATLTSNSIYQTPYYEDIQNQKDLIGDYYHPNNLSKLYNRHGLEHKFNHRSQLLDSIAKIWDGPTELVWNHGLAWSMNLLEKKRLGSGSISNRGLLKALDPAPNNEYLAEEDSKHSLFKKLRKRYKVALIDEFQDTDPVQWRLLKKVFGESSTHLLLMVGDPKQAIYRFRGGDLNTYKKARTEVERIDALLTNFRTTPLLMEGLNNFMSKGLQRSSLKVPSLIPCSKIAPLAIPPDQHPLQLIEIRNSSSRPEEEIGALATKKQLEEEIPKIVTNHIIRLLKNHPETIGPADICILVNNHRQSETIRRHLSIAELPSRLINKGNVFMSESALILQYFLNCLSNPGDARYLKLVACSDLIQWDTNKLVQAEENGSYDELANKFKGWSQRLEEIGLLGCLSELLEGKIVADISKRGRLLSDLNQCSQLVQEEIYRQGLSPKGAARWLKRQRYNINQHIPENHQPNSDIEKDSINVMTIHRSKGLQFKVVLCPYLWQAPVSPKGPLWRMRDKNEWTLSLSASLEDKTCPFEESKKALLEEYERLAYVALTRAQNQLILIWGKGLKQEGNPLVSFLFGPEEVNTKIEELSHEKMIKWLRINNVPISIYSIDKFGIDDTWSKPRPNQKLKLGPTPKRLLDKSWGRYSYSSWIARSQKESILVLNAPETEEGSDRHQNETSANLEFPIENITVNKKTIYNSKRLLQSNNPLVDFPRGTSAGDCLHQILEKLDFQSKVSSKQTTNLINEELRRSGIDIQLLDSVQEGLARVLNIPLGKELGDLRLNQINSKDRIHEMKFDLPICRYSKPLTAKELSKAFNKDTKARYGRSYAKQISKLNFISKGFLTGSIDLVFADKADYSNAKWWVLDWKSNWLGIKENNIISCGPKHYNEASMREQMLLHHYPLQAHLYLVALHRLLKWRLPNYSPDNHLGGYIYMFLRGIDKRGYKGKDLQDKSQAGLTIEKAPIERVLEIDRMLRDDLK